MSKFIHFIRYAFNNHPIISNSIIYGTLYVGAEFSQQTITKKILAEKPKPYDSVTMGRYALFGTTTLGPILTIWYRWLDKRFMGTSLKIIAQKLILDQFLMTPQILILFYVSMSLMERKQDIFKELRIKFLPTFQTSCAFWLPAQSINFVLVPSSFRVVYVGSCSFAWVNILCWLKRQEY